MLFPIFPFCTNTTNPWTFAIPSPCLLISVISTSYSLPVSTGFGLGEPLLEHRRNFFLSLDHICCLENMEKKILSFVQNVKVHTAIDLEKQKVKNDRLFPDKPHSLFYHRQRAKMHRLSCSLFF